MSIDEHCKDSQEYTISNVYYDTDNSSIIRNSLSKPYYKEKLRLRSYSVINVPSSIVFLELKKKIGGIVNKRRAVLALSEANYFLEHGIRPQNMDYLNEQVLNEISYFLKNNAVKPAAYISYDRKALFSKSDSQFRITFVHNIITRREYVSLEKGRFGEYLLPPNQYLMEVKVAAAFPMWLANLLSENQIYQTSYSKYGNEYKQTLLKNQNGYNLRQAV
jgi:SPX domain protein involved in polyphosphate accumulation